ncbi:hypothetical protein [Trueperella pyogenes]|uniref:hypothetical protein n=1 Tax=Trueperella pyogenes TaxID=1661 RepID=UPI00345D6002
MSKTRADETNNCHLIIAHRLARTLTNTHQVMVGVVARAKEVKHMGKNRKQTSAKVASKASKILTDGRYGKDSKSVAASALAQTKPLKRGK